MARRAAAELDRDLAGQPPDLRWRDARIREQVKAGVFPVRLKPDDWTSGSINWLLDVIAPDRKTTGRVLANFGRVVKGGELRLHPVVAGLVDEEMQRKMDGKAQRDSVGSES